MGMAVLCSRQLEGRPGPNLAACSSPLLTLGGKVVTYTLLWELSHLRLQHQSCT